ncbi:MAG TPA: hypothetical protein VMZ31_15500 [Phycisphaerae bacterium]|nr:hypothetical protein [Phycisphaerae bacterium]
MESDRCTSRNRADLQALCVIFGVAVVVRVSFACTRQYVAADTGLDVGSDGYELIAENLLAGRGYRFHPDLGETVSLTPAYPLFLAAIFAVFHGPTLWGVQVAQAMLSSLTACMTYLLGLRFSRRAAFVGGLMYALYPGDIVACSRYLAESLSIVAAVATVLIVQHLLEEPPKRLWGLALGFCFVVAVFSRAVHAMLPVLLLTIPLCLRTIRPHWRAYVRTYAVALLLLVAVSAVWCLRNYKLTGLVMFQSSNTGSTAFDGHYIGKHLGDGRTVRELLRASRLRQCRIARTQGIEAGCRFAIHFADPRDEARLSRVLRAEVMNDVANEPWQYIKRVSLGLGRFWYLGPTPTVSSVALAVHAPLLLLAAIAACQAVRRRDPCVILWVAIILYYNMSSAIVNPLVRYALPAIPFVAALAGATVAGMWARMHLTITSRAGAARKERRVTAGKMAYP